MIENEHNFITVRECGEYRDEMREGYCHEVARVEIKFADDLKDIRTFMRYMLILVVTLLGEFTIALLIFVFQIVAGS